jgi:hypothetical protein
MRRLPITVLFFEDHPKNKDFQYFSLTIILILRHHTKL